MRNLRMLKKVKQNKKENASVCSGYLCIFGMSWRNYGKWQGLFTVEYKRQCFLFVLAPYRADKGERGPF